MIKFLLFFSVVVFMPHKVIEWIESNLQLAQKPVVLLDWEKSVIKKMYSPEGKILIPNLGLIGSKKTGKSAFASMLVSYRFFHRKKELYTISSFSESNAFIVFESFFGIFGRIIFCLKLKYIKIP